MRRTGNETVSASTAEHAPHPRTIGAKHPVTHAHGFPSSSCCRRCNRSCIVCSDAASLVPLATMLSLTTSGAPTGASGLGCTLVLPLDAAPSAPASAASAPLPREWLGCAGCVDAVAKAVCCSGVMGSCRARGAGHQVGLHVPPQVPKWHSSSPAPPPTSSQGSTSPGWHCDPSTR